MTTKTNSEIGFVKDHAIKQKNPLVNTPDLRISGFPDFYLKILAKNRWKRFHWLQN